jgi:hypothetical protein
MRSWLRGKHSVRQMGASKIPKKNNIIQCVAWRWEGYGQRAEDIHIQLRQANGTPQSGRRRVSPSKMMSPLSERAATALATSAVSKSSCLSRGIAALR